MKDEQIPEAPPPSPAEQAGAKAEDRPRLRLRSLKVHAFRDIRPGTELHFGNGTHLILGKNGSGKSTLLELLAAVSTLNFRRPFFAETPFHLKASFEVGEVLFHVEVTRSFALPRAEAIDKYFVDLPPNEEAETTIRIENSRRQFCLWARARSGAGLHVFKVDPDQVEGKTAPGIELLSVSDPLRLSVVGLMAFVAVAAMTDSFGINQEQWQALFNVPRQPGVGVPFDEALGALTVMTGNGMTVVRGKMYGSTSPWFPAAFDFNAAGEPVKLELSQEHLLEAAIKELGYDEAMAYFGPATSTNAGWNYSSPSFQFFRKGKAVRRHDQLSFGQKRLFSFAWYLACNPDVAIADELVNGLHADWIDWCVEALADRQCFLTSQNPLLVDEMTFASDEDLRRGIILCEAVHDAERDTTELVWRQLDDRETSIIAGALEKSRLDLLSDLLRALDLW